MHVDVSWKQVLPVDGFRVRMTQYPADTDRQVLTQLYQPLIGAQATNFYQTLYHRLPHGVYQSEGSTHHELMIIIGETLTTLLEARRKLEAVGLLKTYVKAGTGSEDRQFIYEILPPMSPRQFFEDDVLSVFLYNRIGKSKYRRLRQQFLVPEMGSGWTEMTASFNDVFTSLHPSELVPTSEQLEGQADGQLVTNAQTNGVFIQEDVFDFELLYQRLPSFFNRDQLLTDKVKKAVGRLAFVYRIDPASMSQLIQQALVGDEEVDIGMLRKKVQEWYRMSFGQTPPKLGLRVDKPQTQENTSSTEPVDDEKATIRYFEMIAPLTLLESFSEHGAEVSPSDARLVESLLFDYQLQPGVANVLIDYVMRTNNRKLNARYVETIAGHWSRMNLKTVEDAMELAKHENKKKQWSNNQKQNQQGKKKSKQGNQSKNRSQHKERLPKWLTGDVTEASDEEKRKRVSEDREQIQTLLQQYRKG
ncbi:replication initiation and membrane attachment family protein [Natribacillus halophilus]|uniref:Replicative DNA helicase loader DnaB n=1 Tax=Natribacillus halophilus TaxID=549003 RepID=A0A1G8RYE3_9BACI|nr:DnaD domain protein [Natribacillus halophilus]SDJ21998.1 replicative DNA helicase loader DnaB [Natribacillus halophilus]